MNVASKFYMNKNFVYVYYAIDYGSGKKLVIYGPNGVFYKKDLHLPSVKGGKTDADDFERIVQWLLNQVLDSNMIPVVVTESSTIGSSGVEPERINTLMANRLPFQLQNISTREIKIYCLDNDLVSDEISDEKAAEIIYKIATEQPEHMKQWNYVEECEKLQRNHTSVRPHDRRGYRDLESDEYMSRLPPFSSLNPEHQELLGNEAKTDYHRPIVMPLAMVWDEKDIETRKGFEKVIGLYGHGYPSFYRKNNEYLMKKQAGVSIKDHLPKNERKPAWKKVRKLIRAFYHVCMEYRSKGHHRSQKGHIESLKFVE